MSVSTWAVQALARPGERSGPRALPDVNAETYPYAVVQRLLDQTADFVLAAVPDAGYAETATLTPAAPDDFFGLNGGYGLALRCALHRLEVTTRPPAPGDRWAVAQAVGECVATLRCRWLFGPDDLAWAPGREPPPALYDPWRSQQFALLDAGVRFAGPGDGFLGYGVGRTFPVVAGGRPHTLAGAIGNLTGGCGKFEGLEGTFVLTGAISPTLGFQGAVTCRVVDPHGRLRSGREVPPLRPAPDPIPGATFLVLRGEKTDASVQTTYGRPPGDGRVSLVTPSQMRSARPCVSARGAGGLKAARRVGPVLGTMDATVYFDLLAPPGTAAAPVPFTTDEVYRFVDDAGQPAGTVAAGVDVGASFGLKFPAAPGQPGVRFAGFGPIRGGTGQFAGARGLLTVNSLIGIAPHALSLLHVLHLVDPDGKFGAGARGRSAGGPDEGGPPS